MPEQENQSLEGPAVVMAPVASSRDDDSSDDEYKAMLYRAKRLRLTANGILVVVGGLLLFGGYVFFQAANITTRDYTAVLESAERRENELQMILKDQQVEAARLRRELLEVTVKMNDLERRALTVPRETPIPTPTATP